MHPVTKKSQCLHFTMCKLLEFLRTLIKCKRNICSSVLTHLLKVTRALLFITKQKKRIKEQGLVLKNSQKYFLFQYYNQPHFTKEPLCEYMFLKKKKKQKLMSKPECSTQAKVSSGLNEQDYWTICHSSLLELSLWLVGGSPARTVFCPLCTSLLQG